MTAARRTTPEAAAGPAATATTQKRIQERAEPAPRGQRGTVYPHDQHPYWTAAPLLEDAQLARARADLLAARLEDRRAFVTTAPTPIAKARIEAAIEIDTAEVVHLRQLAGRYEAAARGREEGGRRG